MGTLADERWMRLALTLAEKGRLSVSPNPMVGAVVVRGGKKIASGYHALFGGPHAEVRALKQAGRRARGATLYVTLEPCASWGKTPPCAEAVMDAGIREVVIGMTDVNPANRGRGIRLLKQAGIRVRTGVLAGEVQKQNESFCVWAARKRPFVTLKMAQTLDGKIATETGASRWISGTAARKFVHRLRQEQDAILVGKRTLLLDDPLLSPQLRVPKGREDKPWRIFLDPQMEVSPRARIFRGPQLTIAAVSEKTLQQSRKRWPSRLQHVIPLPEKKGRLNLEALLEQLAAFGVGRLLVEGGGELSWSLLSRNLVDRLFWIVAPKILGGRRAVTSVEGEGFARLAQAIPLKTTVRPLGVDWLIEGEPA